ncbi:MAG: YkgJ family cysteine cluster protein [Vicinamibacterales bacterium]
MPQDSSSLCLACGLCCDGLLHHSVSVTADEAGRLRGLGVPVERSGPDAWQFPQPCAAHTDGRCGVYGERPDNCRTYRCTLLRRVEAGAIAPGDALATIRTARALAAECRAQAGGDGSWKSLQAAVARNWDEAGRLRGSGAVRQDGAALSAAVAALHVVLDQHFRVPAGGPTDDETGS